MNDFEVLDLGFTYFMPIIAAGSCFLTGFARWPFVLVSQVVFVEYFTDAGIGHLLGMPEVSMMGPVTKRIALLTAAALAGHWTGRALRGLFSSG